MPDIRVITEVAGRVCALPLEAGARVGDGDDIAIVDRKSLEVLGSIKVPGMQGGGHLINTDAKGNIYIANTGKGMQKLAFKGMSTATAAR